MRIVLSLSITKQVKTGGGGILIHGHTHRPAIHQFQLNGKPAKRIVLSDWRDKITYLRVSESGEFDLVY